LPERLDVVKAGSAISPRKDVDGANPVNLGRLLLGEEAFVPSTAYGVHQLLIRSSNSPEGKHVVICGRSNIVGKPMTIMMLNRDATVTTCHIHTKDLAANTKRADILIVAVGRPNLITADMVKDGAVVVDIGCNRVDGKLCGDVDFDEIAKKASYITPVPGGAGPMTVACLMENVVIAAKRQNNQS